jgi:hypothetical protein
MVWARAAGKAVEWAEAWAGAAEWGVAGAGVEGWAEAWVKALRSRSGDDSGHHARLAVPSSPQPEGNNT